MVATPIGHNRARLDARTAAEATGGTVVRAVGRSAQGVTTDSRAVGPGGAFVALRGEHADGHAFMQAAIDAGATLVVVEKGRAPADPRADVVEVDDTLDAWGRIAQRHLGNWRASDERRRIVGITGSAGKTTTKELCAALLGALSPCLATAGNLNNRIGLPSVALQAEAEHRFAVLEMGMSLRGEIASLAAIARADVGVVVNVGMAHAGGVGGTLDDVADEKGALFLGLAPGGVAVANVDDAAVMARASRATNARVVRFGRATEAEVRVVAREPGPDGSRLVVERAGRRTSFLVPIPGEAASIDFAAALAAAEAAAGPIDDALIASGLASMRPIIGRMNVLHAHGLTVVDDAYNANPTSMRAALEALGEMPATRRVAVLGEMRELGPGGPREHEALADAVVHAGVKVLVSCGGMVDALARAVSTRGVEATFATDAVSAAASARALVRPGDVVLVKASRSVGAERVVAALAGDAAGDQP